MILNTILSLILAFTPAKADPLDDPKLEEIMKSTEKGLYCPKAENCVECCMDLTKAFVNTPENVKILRDACKQNLKDKKEIDKVLMEVSYRASELPAAILRITSNTGLDIFYFKFLCANGVGRKECIKSCPVKGVK